MNRRVLFAAVWGTLIGLLTFSAGPIAKLSDQTVIAAIQIVLTCIMLPGLFVAARVGSFGPAALINAVFHFGVCYFALRFVRPFRKT